MLTILSSPKPFTGDAARHQRAAIESWRALDPDVEIFLYGDAGGAAEVCAEYRLHHVPDVAANGWGTPLFSAIAGHAAAHARHRVHVYVNGDILLTRRLITALAAIPLEQFLLTGQRIDLAEGSQIDVLREDWPAQLAALHAAGQVSMRPPEGADYFVFTRGLWDEVPPLAIGRGGYDNALIGFCLQRGVPVIDATLSVVALHPFHGYGHMVGGERRVYDGEEALINKAYCGSRHALPAIEDATWTLQGETLTPTAGRGNALRALEGRLRYRYGAFWPSMAVRAVRRGFAAMGILPHRPYTVADVLQHVGATGTGVGIA